MRESYSGPERCYQDRYRGGPNAKVTWKSTFPGTRLTVKVTQIHPNLEGVIAKVSEIPDYWGFKIQVLNKSIGEIAHGGSYDLSIATSRTGKAITDNLDELKAKIADPEASSLHSVLLGTVCRRFYLRRSGQ